LPSRAGMLVLFCERTKLNCWSAWYQCCQLQSFSASPEAKFGRSGKKFGPPSKFQFLKKFGLKKNTFICLCEWENFFFSLQLERIREGNQFF
jgi:hypothetical protein